MGRARGLGKLVAEAGVRAVDLHAADWQEQIFSSLVPVFQGSIDQTLGEEVFLNILTAARSKLGARTAVVEPYTSTDWHDEYGRLYSRVFKDVPRQATRIHFFLPVGNGGYLKASRLLRMSEQVRKAYLGYTVLRPLPAFRVGDTVMASPCRIGTANGEARSGSDLVHCLAAFDVSLLGNHLSITGMPFMQQETAVGVCAEADLWMVARYFNRLGEVRRYRPGEITELATQNLSAGQPRQGLFDLQMVDALRQMGLNPFRFYSRDPDEVKEFIFTCVESELPVIIGVPSHVMVAIGHDCRNPLAFSANQSVAPATMSDCVDNFIVHDDASGPYRMKRATKSPESMVVATKEGGIDLDVVNLFALDDDVVDVCFVCVPHRVNLLWDDVRNHAKRWVEYVTECISAQFDIPGKLLWQPADLSDLVFRTYLRRSDKFKSDLLVSGRAQRHKEIIARYRCMAMPRYVWVVELARQSNLQNSPTHERLIEGEMVFDSTANRHVPYESLLAFHLDGVFYTPEKPTGSATLIYCPTETPYSPLLRPRPTLL